MRTVASEFLFNMTVGEPVDLDTPPAGAYRVKSSGGGDAGSQRIVR